MTQLERVKFERLLKETHGVGRDSVSSRGQELCFLIGAGASVAPPTSLPTAVEFLSAFLELLVENIPRWLLSSIENNWQPTSEGGSIALPTPDFRTYFSARTWGTQQRQSVWSKLRFETILRTLRLSGFDPDLQLLQIYRQDRPPNSLHHEIAGFLNKGSNILTTNFDTMIERAAQSRCSFNYFQNPTLFDKQLLESKGGSSTPILAKLHGTLLPKGRQEVGLPFSTFPVGGRHASGQQILNEIVADLSTIKLVLPNLDENTKAPEPRFELFQRATSGRVLVILGYSGGDDFDIMPLLLQSGRLRSVLWIEHAGNSKSVFEVRNGHRHHARQQLRDQMSFRHSWADALADQDISVTIVKGDTLEIIEVLQTLLKSKIEDELPRDPSRLTPPISLNPFFTDIYKQRTELDWALLLGCLLTTANEDDLACLTFGTCFERDSKLGASSIEQGYVEECYLRSVWRWDYLHHTEFYRRTMAQQIDQRVSSPAPPGLNPAHCDVFRCVYHQAPLAAVIAADDSLEYFQPQPLGDTDLHRRRLLERAILALEFTVESDPNAYGETEGLFERITKAAVQAGNLGSVELTCRALVVSARADKRRLRFCRAAKALTSCLIWARSTGDRRTYAAAAFELALIESHLKDDFEWNSETQLGPAFAKPNSEYEMLEQCILGFDEVYLYTADSLSWFYMNILQSLLPATKRPLPVHTQQLLARLGREYDLVSQLEEAVEYSINSHNRYNRAGLLSALAAARFLRPPISLRLLRRAREHAELQGYSFICAVTDFLIYQDPDFLSPLFWGPPLSRDQRAKVMAYGMQDIAVMRDADREGLGWGNLLRLL